MTFSVNDLIKLPRLNQISVSEDAEFAIAEISTLDKDGGKYNAQLWKVNLKTGSKTQLTFGKWVNRAPFLAKEGSLYFLSNRPTQNKDDKHETRFQLYQTQMGDPVQLSSEPLGVQSFQVADTGSFVLCAPHIPSVDHETQREYFDDKKKNSSTGRLFDTAPVRFWDHWVKEAKSHYIAYVKNDSGFERVDLTPNASREYKNARWTLSKDGTFLVTTFVFRSELDRQSQRDRLDNTGLRKIDISTGDTLEILKKEAHWVRSPVLSDDDSRCAIIDLERLPDRFGSHKICLYTFDDETTEFVDSGFDGDIDLTCFSKDSKGVYFSAAFKGTTSVFTLNLETKNIERKTEKGTVHSFVLRNGNLMGIHSSLTQPPEIFVKKEQEDLRRISNISGFSVSKGFQTSNHSVTSTDGNEVQFYRVKGKESLRNMMVIHGGPVGQWGDVWHWRWNSLVFADMGYNCFLPNPRGSVGFGQKFVDGIFGDSWGGQCYDDLMCVADEMERLHPSSETVVMGGSFGGYMTNWIATQTDRFDALMTHAGLFDLQQFYATTDSPAYWSRVFQQDVYESREAFDKYSPARFVKNWKTPTLVIHGEKDYRVPISEALYLFDALQYFEVPSKLLIFPDENHWILKPRNIETWYKTLADFFDDVLSKK